MGILVCGLNGSGKSTLGRALAEKIGYHFIDIEDLYFARKSGNEPYADPRLRDDVKKLLDVAVKTHPDFVFAAVKGNFGEEICSMYDCIILLEAPKDIRMKRVKERSFQKFGDRMLPGGDLYETEKAFFDMVDSRREELVESWVRSPSCPVIRADGTKPVEENITYILEKVKFGV